MTHADTIRVCGPNDDVPEGALKLCVASRAPLFNPEGWKDLWRLSPFAVVEQGVAVPGLKGVRSQTVENAWQFLKVWPNEGGWQAAEAHEAFRSTCAIRFPRGKGKKPLGSWWADEERLLDYLEARRRIYVPCYLAMIELEDRQACMQRLRAESRHRPVFIWDYDSYDVSRCGMTDIVEAADYRPRPFAHAFVLALVLQGRLDRIGPVS